MADERVEAAIANRARVWCRRVWITTNHVGSNIPYKSRPLVADWMADHIGR